MTKAEEAALMTKISNLTGQYVYRPLKSWKDLENAIFELLKTSNAEAYRQGSIAENQNRPGYRYLSKEIKQQRKDIYTQLQLKNMTPLLHVQIDDVYRWFEARLPVAKLMDKDRIAELNKGKA